MKRCRVGSAASRVAKLPCSTFALTMPERGQLRAMEMAGTIRYNPEAERWEDNRAYCSPTCPGHDRVPYQVKED